MHTMVQTNLGIHYYTGAGAYAGCSYCCVKGEYCHPLDKMVYLQHRAFLPSIDALRSDSEKFPSKSVPDSPPEMKTMEFVDRYNAKLSAPSTSSEHKTNIRESGCTGSYSLRSLPNHDRHLNTPVEPMHCIKNVAERLIKLLSGTTDTVKVRMAEQQYNRFRSAWVKTILKNGKQTLHTPPAPFSLQREGVITANSRAMCIRAPSGVDWKPCHLFGKSTGQLNSNQWKHVLSSGILKYCIRGLLEPDQRSTLMELCDVMQLLTAEAVHLQDLDAVEYRVHHVLSLLERDFPIAIHVITLHLLHHLPMYLKRFGPTYGFWMYPMERFNSWISRRILNRRFPESNVMETYRIFEFTFFLQISGQLPSGSTTDISTQTTFENENEGVQASEVLCMEDIPREHGSSAVLESSSVKDLISFYCSMYPEYAQLLSRYKKEKSRTKRKGRVEHYPPLSQWSPEDGRMLTESELNLREEPSCDIIQYKVYTTRDKHNRRIKYETVAGERANSVHVSSYVQLCCTDCDGKVFGRIKSIFRHKFNGTVHTLADMQWYESSTHDRESGLMYCSLSSSNKSIPRIVSLEKLSRPLIHAVDEDKIWILNSPF